VFVCRKVGIPRAEPKIVERRQFKYFNSFAFQYDLKMAFQRHYTTSIIMPTQIMRGRYGKYKLNKDLLNALKWLSANKVTLNNEQIKYMIIASMQRLKNLGHVPKSV
jgi:hypothetical protein